MKVLSNNCDNIKSMALKNAPGNYKLTSPDIQKDMVHVCAIEISNAIVFELGDSCFPILVDESRDVSTKNK